MGPAALDGISVVDFSRVLAGPLVGMTLGDLGADVVKVEAPGGDDTRRWLPPSDAQGRASYHHAANRNKRSVALDLDRAPDLALARQLCERADVVVSNFKPGTLERFGLDYATVSSESSQVVYCEISGFGEQGGRDMPGYDPLVQALGGLMSITGPPEGEPQKVGVALVDVLAGLFSTVGILAALRHRDTTGEGQRVEVNLLSSLLAALVNQGSAYTAGGKVPTRMGNQHPSIAPYELLRTGDGDLVLAVGNDRQFASLCEVVGEPALSTDPRFAVNASRVAHRVELRDALERVLSTQSAPTWATALTAAGVPAGVVNDMATAFRLAADLGLEPVVDVPRPDGTTVALTRNPIGMSATPPVYRSAPPRLGRHRIDAHS